MTARTDPDTPGAPAPGYAGPAVVVIDGAEYPVTVELRGTIQPIDGIFRWYGRIVPCSELDAAIGGGSRPGRLRTPAGEADATIGDRDFWDRYRVTGRGRPPFETPFDRAGSGAVPRATR